jgi:imidazolonepropionase
MPVPSPPLPAFETDETVDCEGRWITPGLIDPHTHLVFAGDRAHEFELRLAGASYEEIARAGGGIVSTMTATRAASEAELVAAALPRLDALIAEGVTTVEIKSGYGLSLDDELKSCAPPRPWPTTAPSVTTTFLGAHALPPNIQGRSRRLYRRGLPRDDPRRRRRGPGRRGRRVLRGHRLHARPDPPGVRGGHASTACRSSCTPSSCRT